MGWLFAFVLALARDFVVARWTKEVASGSRWTAALYAAVPPFLDLSCLLLWLQDWQTVIPTALGYSVGTWLATSFRRRDAA